MEVSLALGGRQGVKEDLECSAGQDVARSGVLQTSGCQVLAGVHLYCNGHANNNTTGDLTTKNCK